uniref:ARAD1C34826p n=1 Tax=Blastobotrys adeninivorans TaxID=409370 RepID=A0A060T892_BLAAD
MYRRTVSTDSGVNIRTNPLNIRHLDGSDLVLSRNDIEAARNQSRPRPHPLAANEEVGGRLLTGQEQGIGRKNSSLSRPQSVIAPSSFVQKHSRSQTDALLESRLQAGGDDDEPPSPYLPLYTNFGVKPKPRPETMPPLAVDRDISELGDMLNDYTSLKEKIALDQDSGSADQSKVLPKVRKASGQSKTAGSRKASRDQQALPPVTQAPRVVSAGKRVPSAKEILALSPASHISLDSQPYDPYRIDVNLENSPNDLTSTLLQSYANLSLPTNMNAVHGGPNSSLQRRDTITSKTDKSIHVAASSSSPKEFARMRSVREHRGYENKAKDGKSRSPEIACMVISDDESQSSARKYSNPPSLVSISASTFAEDTQSVYSREGEASSPPGMDNDAASAASEPGARTPLSAGNSPNAEQGDDSRSPVDPTDRGRLFLQINGLKDVKLPLLADRKPKFQLTLDNGIQCVTTYPIDFNVATKNAKIDQEFELIVGHDLELLITLTGSMDPPKPVKVPSPQLVEQSRPMTPPSSPKKKSRFNIFSSPKKKKEKELSSGPSSPVKGSPKKASPVLAPAPPPKPENPWRKLVGKKGEFARSYIVESEIESEVFGRSQSFSIPCFAEWAGSGNVNDEPTIIARLEVTLMYVPKAFKEEELPPSLEAAVKAIQTTKSHTRNVSAQGYLSQQGGDCSYWRRRWFELDNGTLVACHEESKKVRHKIALSDAECVYDDREDRQLYDNLAFRMMMKEGKKDYMFLADSKEGKQSWIKALNMAIDAATGRDKSWIDLIHDRRTEESAEREKMKEYEVLKSNRNNSESSFVESC